MNILVLGATGFIGSNLISTLTANQIHTIYAVKRHQSSKPRLNIPYEPNWIDSIDSVDDLLLKKIDLVVDLSAHTANPPYDSIDNCIYWNVYKKTAFVEKAIDLGVMKFIFFGSCFEYGLSANDYDYIPENARTRPINAYALSKALFSKCLETISYKNPNILFTLFRLFHVYGEGESENRLWPSLKKAAISGNDFEITSGVQVRDFMEVKELCKTIVDYINRIAEHVFFGNDNFNIYNLATGHAQSVKEFSEKWWVKLNASGNLKIGTIEHRENDLMRIVANTEKLKKLL